jgi:hypothetical protein
VFVAVRQRVKESKQFTVISTRAWLQTLDEFVRTFCDPTKRLGFDLVPAVDVSVHGETALGGACQGGPQVVKRGARVVNYIAGDDTEWKRWLGDQVESNPKSAIRATDIRREFSNTCAQVGDDFVLKVNEMFLGPDDFCINPTQCNGR